MIVRDEEATLPQALESVRGCARQLVVVDTGSRDRTVEVARSMGARVLQAAWNDDFSAARNVALAAADQDWILALDADQRLDPASHAALAQALRRPVLAQAVTIRMMGGEAGAEGLDSYQALRLFRADPRIRYRGRVHEDVAPSLLELGCSTWPDSGVVLQDIGYVDAGERRRKLERNLALLERARAEQPGDLFVAFKLAQTLPPARGEQRRALLAQAARLALAMDPKERASLPFLPRMLAAAIDAHVDLGRIAEAAQLAPPLRDLLGPHADFLVGRALARCAQQPAAAELLARYAAGAHPADTAEAVAWPCEACLWLAWMARSNRDGAGARDWLQRAGAAAGSSHASQRMELGCETLRLALAEGRLAEAPALLHALVPLARESGRNHRALMLVSAELARAAGDLAGARELAQAAVGPAEDRAAAVLAWLEWNQGGLARERLLDLAAQIAGRRCDTLGVRAVLAQAAGEPLGFPLPDATRAWMDNPQRQLA
jgi:hypothetical protein